MLEEERKKGGRGYTLDSKETFARRAQKFLFVNTHVAKNQLDIDRRKRRSSDRES
jgi:hypothetical protein